VLPVGCGRLDRRCPGLPGARRWPPDGLRGALALSCGVSLFSASTPVKAISLWPVEEGVAGEIVARRKTIVRLHMAWPWGQVRLNGVVVRQEDPEAPEPCFQLPCEGVFRLLVTAAKT